VCEQYINKSDWIHLDRDSVYWQAVLTTVSIGRLCYWQCLLAGCTNHCVYWQAVL